MHENKQIIIDGWRVYDLPVEYSDADYEEARVEITNQVRNIGYGFLGGIFG
ncbi:MAG: hypothetical protein UV99_C0013G0007 [Parcubacteria group bacterium GW2011_GWC1_43_61]|nr:MAG: hypothetical protein UV99_C0013G0007 [Parcubacteria group bacterium GW2011_GWC1_43_61]